MPCAPCWQRRGGVLVGEPPELAFWKEKDGKPGEKTIVSTNYGFKGGQPESMANGLLPVIDNWIYNAAHTYRYRFGGGKWLSEFIPSRGLGEAASHCKDDYGRLYYCSNTDLGRVDPFPGHYFTRNPFYRALAGTNLELIPFDNQDVWPGHPTPGTNRGYTTTELRADGTLTKPTAACGDGIYRGGLFPPEFHNNLFTCEPRRGTSSQARMITSTTRPGNSSRRMLMRAPIFSLPPMSGFGR